MFNFTQTLTIFLLVGACTASHAAEYWISKEKGSDANNCSSASLSCRSIQKGLNILKPGDILNIDKGTYVEDSTNSTLTSKCGLLDANYGSLCIKSSGTAEKPITIRALPGEEGKVIIDSEGKRAGIIISKHDYIHIRNLIFKDSWTGGIATPGGPSSLPTEAILSIGCVLEGNSIINTTGAWGVNNSAIYMWSTKDWIVRNNIIQYVYGEGTGSNGIQSYGTINALIENNTITEVDHGIQWKDHYAVDLEGKADFQESIIRNNKLSVAQTGVRINIRADKANPAGGNNLIEGNIIELTGDSAVGVAAYLAGASGMSGDITVKNNLFVGKASKHKAINADALNSLSVIGNVFVNMEVAISLRLQNVERPAKLVESNYNVYENSFQIQNDKYSGDEETYKALSNWQAAKPSTDQTLISLRVDNPDQYSVQRDNTNVKISAEYNDTIKPISGPNGTSYQPGPYQRPGQIIGASSNLMSSPQAPGQATSKQL